MLPCQKVKRIRHISHGRTSIGVDSSWICGAFGCLLLLSFSVAIFCCVELNTDVKGGKSNSSPNGPYVQKALGDQACKKNS